VPPCPPVAAATDEYCDAVSTASSASPSRGGGCRCCACWVAAMRLRSCASSSRALSCAALHPSAEVGCSGDGGSDVDGDDGEEAMTLAAASTMAAASPLSLLLRRNSAAAATRRESLRLGGVVVVGVAMGVVVVEVGELGSDVLSRSCPGDAGDAGAAAATAAAAAAVGEWGDGGGVSCASCA